MPFRPPREAPSRSRDRRDRQPSHESRTGLDWFAFCVANIQAGFGPFVSVYLTAEHWTQIDIGLVLTVGSIAGFVLQTPGGALVDASRAKRGLAAVSVIVVGLSAAGLAASSFFPVILAAWMLHAAASCTLSPALSAISLGLVGHEGLARRLGRNASFASFGNAVAAAAMGAIGYWLSNRAVFVVTAVLMVPALLALRRIPPDEIDPITARGRDDQAASDPGQPAGDRPASWWALATNRPLMVLLGCVALFYVANAAMLPLVGSVLTLRSRESPALLIAACIIVPQIMVMVLSPLVGTLAQSWGRRPLLLIAFAVLPLRGLAFAHISDPYLFVLAQALDGISGAVLGVLIFLVVADATRRTGHYALAQGVIGTGMQVGGAISTLLGGVLSDRLGSGNAFMWLAIVGLAAFVLLALAMPETKQWPGPKR